MTDDAKPPEATTTPPSASAPGRRRYVPPRVIDYGHVGKLTQSGGITVKDFGNMERKGP